MYEHKLELLGISNDFLDTVETMVDLNLQGELTDDELLSNLKSKYIDYSKEKIRLLKLISNEELKNNGTN